MKILKRIHIWLGAYIESKEKKIHECRHIYYPELDMIGKLIGDKCIKCKKYN